MGLLSFLFGPSKSSEDNEVYKDFIDTEIIVDLQSFKVNGIEIGEAYTPNDALWLAFEKHSRYKPEHKGVEIEVKEKRLHSIFVDLNEFSGSFVDQILLGFNREQVISQFGEPYWQDKDGSGELILFYEYQEGKIEIQFEFPDGEQLEVVSMMKDGVLSKPEQRKSYEVTKKWPPC
jgi:hypothetical protein